MLLLSLLVDVIQVRFSVVGKRRKRVRVGGVVANLCLDVFLVDIKLKLF